MKNTHWSLLALLISNLFSPLATAQEEVFLEESPEVEINYRTVCNNDQWVMAAKSNASNILTENAQISCHSRVAFIYPPRFIINCHSILTDGGHGGLKRSWLKATQFFSCRTPGRQVTGVGKVSEAMTALNTKRRFAIYASWSDARAQCNTEKVYLVSPVVVSPGGTADAGSVVTATGQFECGE